MYYLPENAIRAGKVQAIVFKPTKNDMRLKSMKDLNESLLSRIDRLESLVEKLANNER